MGDYKYRRHIGWMRTGFLWFFLVAGSLFIVSLSYLGHPAIGLTIGFVLIGEGILLWWVLNRFTKVSVSMEDGALVYRNAKGETRLLYRSISELQFPSIRYLGGWIKIISGDDAIRLTVVVEGIALLLRELKLGLHRHESPALYDDERFFRFFKTAAYADESWARLYEIAWKLLGLVLLSTVLGTVVAMGTDKGIGSKAALIFLGPLWVIAAYCIAEVMFARWLGKSVQKADYTYSARDRLFETSVYRKSLLIGTVSYLACLMLIWAS